MDERLQRRVQRYGWDKAAAQYEGYWHQQLEPALARLRSLAGCQPGERVLDVACGTGLVTFPVADDVAPNGSVFGVDISERMIEIAKDAAATRGYRHARFERMDAEELRVDDASFDVALCSLGLMYVPNPRQALQEMHRALAPGARAVVSVWGQRDRCGWAELFSIVDARVASEVCPMFYRLGGGDALRWEMEAAGFTQVTTERIETQLRYASPDDACGAAFEGGPVSLAYSRFDAQVRDAVRDEYLASIDTFRHENGYAVPGEFVIGVGRKD